MKEWGLTLGLSLFLVLCLTLFWKTLRNSPSRNASDATALRPAFAESVPEQAPSPAYLATNLYLPQVEHIKSGTTTECFDLNLDI
jgi:hypothetical protein